MLIVTCERAIDLLFNKNWKPDLALSVGSGWKVVWGAPYSVERAYVYRRTVNIYPFMNSLCSSQFLPVFIYIPTDTFCSPFNSSPNLCTPTDFVPSHFFCREQWTQMLSFRNSIWVLLSSRQEEKEKIKGKSGRIISWEISISPVLLNSLHKSSIACLRC